ncbi:MAG: hypothetical protein K0V04_11710 [Deltaproteobacteria bacterium]|nr:hypothetical protein [Deltaproteobacteria bacterium]
MTAAPGSTGVGTTAGDGGSAGDTRADETGETGGSPDSGSAHRSCQEDEGVIQAIPAGFDNYAAEGFDRYAEVIAPNGLPIRIFAQDQVSDLMIHRARNLLRFYLADVAGSMYGADKDDVANFMADNEAVLAMPNGAHTEGNEPNVPAQPLYQDEAPVDGSAWYLDNDYEHRDAALEEIFHLVHDTGIGTNIPGARPKYQALLDAEARASIEDGRWAIPIDPGVARWIEELDAEGSLAQEYIASVIDSYYGLWGAFDEPGGMWGIYIAKTRAEVYRLDAPGAALLEHFLPPYLDYEARLDPTLTGTFAMRFDPAVPYTHKSQYLLQATLTGTNDSSLLGNAGDNTLRGNAGNNRLDGGDGQDTAVFCGSRGDYTVSVDGKEITVSGPDGNDTLVSVEWVHFGDGLVATSDL